MTESGTKCLLLVEDETILAMTEKMQLESYGYAVHSVASGEKAVQAVDTMPELDLVLMDINLGAGIDGTEAAGLILKTHDIPIVFLSSHSEREIVEKTEKITSYGYVLKNSSLTVLDASIKMAFKLFDAKQREQKREEDLRESEQRIQKKLNALISADASIAELELADIIDVESVQALMEAFYEFTGFPVAILDLGGKILVKTGWQDICTKFHRVHPETLQNCIECDTMLAKDVPVGAFKSYLCKNNLWDNVTPLLIGGNHVGNLFTGQFFYEGEKPADSVFRAQAQKYGFDETEYMAAVHRVPVWKREHADNGLRLYAKLANTISSLSHSNLSLAKSLEGQKQIASTLQMRESRWSALVNTIPDFISILDDENRFLFLNHYAEGFHEKDVLNQSVFKFLSPASCEVFKNGILESRQKQTVVRFEHTALGHFNTMRDYDNYALPIADSTGNSNVMVVSRDITERKNSEEELKKYQERLRFALEGSGLAEWDWNLQTGQIQRSARWAEMLGYTLPEIESTLQQCVDLQHPDDRASAWQTVQEHLQGKTAYYVITYRMLAKNGQYRWILDCGKVMERDEAGNPLRLCGTHADITDQKEKEEKITSLLAEKELLLREVHHRIKNNMNTISSLLSLQAGTVTDPVALDVLADAGNRVRSMSILYDKLYRSADFAELSIKDYLSSLVDDIIANFPNSTRVSIEKNLQDCKLDTQRLQTLGIIINELLTNIMKYAFRNRDHGNISVSATKAAGVVAITVQDNGVGLPAAVSFENSTGFGLQLVESLSQQLDGAITIERSGGTRICLTFLA